MTDLSPSTWLAITKASRHFPQDGPAVGRFIALSALRAVLRKSKRTTSQNALLWSIYQQILDQGGEAMAGWSREDLHEFFLIDYFGSETKELWGRKKLKPLKRSSRLTKSEFSDYVDHIVRFMAERGVVLEMPDDQRDAA